MIANKIRPQVNLYWEYKIWLFMEYLLNDIIQNIPEFANFTCSRQTDVNLGNIKDGVLSYHLSSSNRIYNKHYLTNSIQSQVRLYITVLETPINKDKLYKLTNLLINLLTENWNSTNSISNTYNFTVDGTELKTDLTMNEVVDEPFTKAIRIENIPNHIVTTFTIKFKIFK